MKLKRYLSLIFTAILMIQCFLNQTMAKESKMMEKFDFLLGNWNLESRVPKSEFSEAATGTGTGTIKRALDDKYVYFDYASSPTTGKTEKAEILRVIRNPANVDYDRRGVITKGTVIETKLGLARVTSRPGQQGLINAILMPKEEKA